ncbi:MAG: hypothetical protein ABSA86_11450 [Oryzomonas sp.]
MKKLILLAMVLLPVAGCATLQSQCNDAWGKLDEGRAKVATLPAEQCELKSNLSKSLDDAETQLRAQCGDHP